MTQIKDDTSLHRPHELCDAGKVTLEATDASLRGVCGIVLAGVHAWGECPLERWVPRPLLPIADRPLISHIVGWLRSGGVNKVAICANSDTGALRRWLGNGEREQVRVEYFEDVMPRGPAGCARDAAVLTASQADRFIVVDGTIVPRIDLSAVLTHHAAHNAALTVVVASVPTGDPQTDAILEPVGIYVFSRDALAQVPDSGYQDIKERLIPHLHESGHHIVPFVIPQEQVQRVTSAQSYLDVSADAVDQMLHAGTPTEEYDRRNDAFVHRTATIAASARLVGPMLIRPGVVIEEDVMVIGPTTIGQGSRLGAGAIVSRSMLWSRCSIGQGAVLDHCIVAHQVEVEPETAARDVLFIPAESTGLGSLRQWLSTRGAASSTRGESMYHSSHRGLARLAWPIGISTPSA